MSYDQRNQQNVRNNYQDDDNINYSHRLDIENAGGRTGIDVINEQETPWYYNIFCCGGDRKVPKPKKDNNNINNQINLAQREF